ncbi:uncharacterized protein [Clytia hemisphaerica]|uniref:Uncharacterized protein n=1 Tax=Clytia hemisphaerica TaxID=252671 RepID=A0A7M5X0H7_9CNID
MFYQSNIVKKELEMTKMKKLLILSFVCLLSQQAFSLVVRDEFIVDEDQPLHKPHSQEGSSKIKKSITTKPVVHSMAMSSAPKMKQGNEASVKSEIQSTKKHIQLPIALAAGSMAMSSAPKKNLGVEHSTRNEIIPTKKHIEPPISLEQSLKNLDIASGKRATVYSSSDNHGKKSDEIKDTISQQAKKSASPNILTNSTITGFLSNNSKFTIDSVGTTQDDVKKKKESEEKVAHNIITKSSKNITLRDTVAKVNGANQVIKINQEPLLSTKSQLFVHNKSLSDLAPVEHAANIHIATEDDFVKLRYVKKKEIEENAVKKEIVSTYHEAECNAEKKCPKNKYCRGFHCFESHRKHHECDEDDECADDMPCIYGRCDDKAKGSPGGICDKDGDCGDGCCVIEPTIDEHHGICKVKLEEFHQCSPVLFRKIWIGEKPECGPCADGLECVERGIHSSHLICMKKK